MDKYFLCETYWILYDVVCNLEDRQDAGQNVDEDAYSEARAEFERHKRECRECHRPKGNE